ncbi:hypothetical protein BDZ94DRAFT_1268915 [Collybia nuda]|uniref:C2H2-type domain-containing protein n=1 Tax=Collybia nuda TaxID=64659 RepID=A0A9P5XYS1_9AGAR|nr:hypothetical protein BDZ94DRAFT_1268915 [Collybia nuda]
MPSFDCRSCSRQLRSVDSLFNHCYSTGHIFGCKPCRKRFYTANSLSQHLRDSSAHAYKGKRGKAQNHRSSPSSKGKKFNCLFCSKEFDSPSAVAMHIESGYHNVTRHQVTAAIHKLRIVPTISVNRRLKGPISPPTTIVTYSATRSAFNGVAYECCLCHHTFRTRQSLNSHLNSPAHDANEFKCPGAKCGHSFKLVSGLIQHIESGACRLARFKEIQGRFESLTNRFSRALTF